MRTVLFFALATGGLVVIAAASVETLSGGPDQARAVTPRSDTPRVSVTTVTAVSWQPALEENGEVHAAEHVDVAPEVNGVVDEIDFDSGQDVATGAILFRLRLDNDAAKLEELQANARLASINLDRDHRLFEGRTISRASLDAEEANVAARQAQVANQVASMAEKVIRAPFAGHLGIRKISLGEYISSGQAAVILNQITPLYVDVRLPQQAIGQVSSSQGITIQSDASGARRFHATVTASDGEVSATSRMGTIRARLEPTRELLPGMFVTATIPVGLPVFRLTIPQQAVSYNPFGQFVYVVERQPDGSSAAKSRVIKTGTTRGNVVVVSSGLKAGEKIVIAGQMKLRDGQEVLVEDSNAQPKDAVPTIMDE